MKFSNCTLWGIFGILSVGVGSANVWASEQWCVQKAQHCSANAQDVVMGCFDAADHAGKPEVRKECEESLVDWNAGCESGLTSCLEMNDACVAAETPGSPKCFPEPSFITLISATNLNCAAARAACVNTALGVYQTCNSNASTDKHRDDCQAAFLGMAASCKLNYDACLRTQNACNNSGVGSSTRCRAVAEG